MKDLTAATIIDHLWEWVRTFKSRTVIKDTTKILRTKFDCYLDSTISDPLSFSLFELSDKGELIINDVTKIMESEAAFFLFVNTKSGWIVAVRNTQENIKKLIKQEPVQNLKVRIIP